MAPIQLMAIIERTYSCRVAYLRDLLCQKMTIIRLFLLNGHKMRFLFDFPFISGKKWHFMIGNLIHSMSPEMEIQSISSCMALSREKSAYNYVCMCVYWVHARANGHLYCSCLLVLHMCVCYNHFGTWLRQTGMNHHHYYFTYCTQLQRNQWQWKSVICSIQSHAHWMWTCWSIRIETKLTFAHTVCECTCAPRVVHTALHTDRVTCHHHNWGNQHVKPFEIHFVFIVIHM